MKSIRTVEVFCILFLCSVLISCEENTPTPPTGKQTEDLKEKALALSSFLTANYSEGDSLFFETESGATEGFVVKQNDFEELTEIIEVEVGEEFTTCVAGYRMQTILQSKSNVVMVLMFYMLGEKENEIDGTVVINDVYSTERSSTAIDDCTLSITIEDKECTLKKGVGITSIINGSQCWNLLQ